MAIDSTVRNTNLYTSYNIVPASEPIEAELLEEIRYGLDNIPDEHEKANQFNDNVHVNTAEKDSIIWPNANQATTNGMALGLEALETLGSHSSNEFTLADTPTSNIPPVKPKVSIE